MIPKWIFLISIVAFFSCASNDKKAVQNNFDEISEAINNFPSLKKKKYVLVIPNAGCGGCISEAETFVSNNYHASDSLCSIFTNLKSSKQIKLRFGDSVYYHPNVIIDTSNRFLFKEKSVYPILIELKDGIVKKVTEQSPENPNTVNNLKLALQIK